MTFMYYLSRDTLKTGKRSRDRRGRGNEHKGVKWGKINKERTKGGRQRERRGSCLWAERRGLLFYFLCGYTTTALSVWAADTAQLGRDILHSHTPKCTHARTHTCIHIHTCAVQCHSHVAQTNGLGCTRLCLWKIENSVIVRTAIVRL